MSATETVVEWKHLPIGSKGGLKDSDAQRVHTLAERISSRLRGRPPILTRTAKPSLRAHQVVGILTTPRLNVEILPKIGAENEFALRKSLVRMLAVAKNLPIADHEVTQLGIQHENLLEVLIRIFSNRLRTAVRRGLPHRYIHVEDNLPRLKGKLNIQRQFSQNAVRPDRLACIFDEFSADTPLNRILKATVVRLINVSNSEANIRVLTELYSRFDEVGESPDPLRERVMLDRTNRTFHQLYALAKLLLSGDWQSTTTGRVEGFSLLFPMNELFEEYIGRSLKTALPSRSVELQQKSRCAIERPSHRFWLQPDIVVDSNIIVDTKWKQLRPDDRNFGVEQADIYQMLAYARAYNAKRVILLYSWHRGLEAEPGIYRQWQATGTSMPFDIATVDVTWRNDAIRGTLRKIVGSGNTPDMPRFSQAHRHDNGTAANLSPNGTKSALS